MHKVEENLSKWLGGSQTIIWLEMEGKVHPFCVEIYDPTCTFPQYLQIKTHFPLD